MSSPTSPDPGPAQLGEADRDHYDAVLDAEVARLVTVLRDARVIRESTLRQRAHADLWGAPGFDAALAKAIEQGQVEELLGYVRLPTATDTDEELRQDLLARVGARLRARRRPAGERPVDGAQPADEWW